MVDPQSALKGELERMPGHFFDIYREASGDDYAAVGEAQLFFKALPDLGQDPFAAGKAVWRYLLENGHEYDERVFRLSDTVQKKRGNCLGRSMLIGAALLERGFAPRFQIDLHPKDAVDRREQKLFEQLCQGDYFDYDNPTLPEGQDKYPILRFAPVEHPSLLLGGRHLEVTSDDLNDNVEYSPESELVQEVSFNELASCLYIDRAKMLFGVDPSKTSEIKSLYEKAIGLWPGNREAWGGLWDVSTEFEDTATAQRAKEEYLKIAGNDSRFQLRAYLMTGEASRLAAAREKYPAFIAPFLQEQVFDEKDPRAEKFNFAVAAWCIKNSNLLSLDIFYRNNKDRIVRLFGPKKYDQLTRRSPGLRP